MKKRVLAFLLVFCMVVGFAPAAVAAGTTVTTAEQLAEEVAKGGEIILGDDIVLTQSLTIASGKTVTLDLNGNEISMEDSSGAACYMIKNDGNLTIKDSSASSEEAGTGKVTFVSTTPSANYGYSTSTIGNGGTLTVESGTIENTTTGGASYAIDNYWYTQDVTLNIDGGTMTAKGIAVRQVPFSTTYKNVVNITGGTLTGSTAGLQIHNYSTAATLSEVNIDGGTFNGEYAFYTYYSKANTAAGTDIEISGGVFNGYLFLYNGIAGSDAYPMRVAITGGTFNGAVYVYTSDDEDNAVDIPCVTGGTFTYEQSELLVDGYEGTGTDDGKWFVAAAEDADFVAQVNDGIEYTSLADAVNNAASGDTVTLLKDVTLASGAESAGAVISKPVTINLNDNTITANAARGFRVYADATFKNGTIQAQLRCIDTRTNVTLNLEDVTLTATGTSGDVQPLTIGGSTAGTVVNAKNCVIDASASTSSYGIIVWVKSTITLDNTKVVGWSNIYLKGKYTGDFTDGDSAGSVVTVKNGSFLKSTNVINDTTSNDFGSIVIDDSNITVNIVDSTVNAVAESTARQHVALIGAASFYDGTVSNSKINISGNSKIALEIACVGGTDNAVVVTGGYFTSDPSEYCDTGLTGVANTGDNKADYPWTVGEQGETPAVAAGMGIASVKDPVLTNATEAEQEMAGDIADFIIPPAPSAIPAYPMPELSGAALDTAVATKANNNTVEVTEDMVAEVKELRPYGWEDLTAADITIVTQPYKKIEITDVSMTEGGAVESITLDITPMVRTLATYLTPLAIEYDPLYLAIAGETLDDNEPTAVQIGEAEELHLTGEVQVSFCIPADLLGDVEYVYVKHEHEGVMHTYKATVTPYGRYAAVISFTNPNGFSEFTLLSEYAPAARIGDEYYETLEEAVNAASNGDMIVLLGDNTEEISVGRTVNFYIDKNGKTFDTAKITAGAYTTGGYVGDLEGAYHYYSFTYTAPYIPAPPA